ncbi:hypothetical protein BN903_291 [Halorubrum sp. AJ67]|nr:hypothetical protein BN903_291 [Halorubrum sp. AJ67]
MVAVRFHEVCRVACYVAHVCWFLVRSSERGLSGGCFSPFSLSSPPLGTYKTSLRGALFSPPL